MTNKNFKTLIYVTAILLLVFGGLVVINNIFTLLTPLISSIDSAEHYAFNPIVKTVLKLVVNIFFVIAGVLLLKKKVQGAYILLLGSVVYLFVYVGGVLNALEWNLLHSLLYWLNPFTIIPLATLIFCIILSVYLIKTKRLSVSSEMQDVAPRQSVQIEQSIDNISKIKLAVVLILANLFTWVPMFIWAFSIINDPNGGLGGLVMPPILFLVSIAIIIIVNIILLTAYKNKNGSFFEKASLIIIVSGFVLNVIPLFNSFVIDPINKQRYRDIREKNNAILDSATSYSNCKNISTGYIELNCVEKIYKDTGDLDGCLQYVPNPGTKLLSSTKGQCIKNEAINKKDPAICDMLKDIGLGSVEEVWLENCRSKSTVKKYIPAEGVVTQDVDWEADMIPTSLQVIKIDEDNLTFKLKDDILDTSPFILESIWNNGTPISMSTDPERVQEAHCSRGTTFSSGEATMKVTHDVNYFYCNKSLAYYVSSQSNFNIWKLVLKETNDPNIFDIVDYRWFGEDY